MPQRLTSIYIALLLTVFLLAVPLNGGYTVIAEFKHSIFIIICGGYVLSIIVLRVMYVITGTQPVGDIRKKINGIPLAAKFMLGYLLFTILSAALSTYPGTLSGYFRQEGALTISLYVLSSFFISVYFRPQKWMLFLLGTVMIPVVILAVVQLTGANPFTLYPCGHNFYGSGVYYTGQFISTIGNTTLVAAFVCLTAGVLAMTIIKLDFWERWLLAIPLFLVLLLIFEMGVDAAFIALFAGFALMLPVAVTSQKTLADTLIVLALVMTAFVFSHIFIFSDGYFRMAPVRLAYAAMAGFMYLLALLVSMLGAFAKIPAKWYRVGSAAVVLGGIGFALIYLWLYNGEPAGMAYEAAQILRGRWEDDFGTRRVFIWRNVLEGINRNTLLFGTGPDTLGHWDIPYFYRVDDAGRIFITNIDAAHNELLHILATGGLLSFLAYFCAIIIAMVNWYRRPANTLSAIAGAGVLLYIIQGFFGISQFITAPFFWGCLGVLLGSVHISINTGAQAV